MALECSNPGHDNRFTCPNCYEDFKGVSTKECPACKSELHCEVITQPVAVCTLGPADDEDEE
jgi:hypothetical protein